MKKQSAGRRVRREKIRRKKMQVREKVGKSRNTVFFRGFVAPEGWKVGSLKRRVRRHLGRWEMKSCTPLWREADFEVKSYKTPQRRTTFGSSDVEKCTALWREAHLEVKRVKNWGVRTTFGSWDVEKVHGVVARSTFRSQNVQNTPWSDHFWKLRCRKSAHHGGAKHISKSKCTKHTILGPLLEVEMLKKCTPLWREAHFATLHNYTPLHYTPLHSTTLNYTTLHYTTLHYTPLHYTKLHYTTLHYTTLHPTSLNYITLHYTTFHYTSLHYTTLHSTTLQLQLLLYNYTPLHWIHNITLHY